MIEQHWIGTVSTIGTIGTVSTIGTVGTLGLSQKMNIIIVSTWNSTDA